jgi:protein O-GlcNAc transferase
MGKSPEIETIDNLFEEGKLEEAETILKEMLQKKAEDTAALHYMGMIHYQKGEFNPAIEYIQKSLQINPENPEAHYDLGNAFLDIGKLDEAIGSYQEALKYNENYADAYSNLGLAYHEKGQPDEAVSFYRKALEINPDLPYTNNNLGLALEEKGETDGAMQYYQKALEINPNYADACFNLGKAYQLKGEHEKAVPLYQKAVALNPNIAEAFEGLGDAFKDLGSFKEAGMSYHRFLTIEPDNVSVLFKLGYILDYIGSTDEALPVYERIAGLAPEKTSARLAHCMAQLPAIFADEDEIESSRTRYRDELLHLSKTITLETPEEIDLAFKAVGFRQPYHLPYQGMNDRELQKIYGELMCRIMAAKYPERTSPPSVLPPLPEEKIRVGFVSGYFHRHSNWKIPMKGWVENLDRQKFSLYGYYTDIREDNETEVARRSFDRFVEMIPSFKELCDIIHGDKLHVLIYPETGMDRMTLRLASLRLAPVQCTSWGHPETSGLSTIDYFLSSDLMEPPDADEHYTEHLVRLPNLSINYAPLEVPAVHETRGTFGLRPEAVLYFCSQMLSKYLPKYDDVFPRIALEVADCQLVFIESRSHWFTERFRKRLSRSFQKYGLAPEEYIVFLPGLEAERYHAVNLLSDVFLDSIGWSGCNSTLEAIACDLPVVTMQGDLMRGRHSSAILTMMGMTETVTKTVDEYVALAVKLGLDIDFRDEISEEIAKKKDLIYRDMTCVKALEEFLEKTVRG